MKQEFQQLLDDVNRASVLADQQDQKIAELQAELNALKPKVVTLTNIQTGMPETLWYEARDASAPKTGPHGTVAIVPGSPATADFHPTALASGHSDNCYNLFRKYPELTAAERIILETAKNFSISCDYLFDPTINVQAAELDYQIRKSNGIIINVGPQLLPLGGGWQVRGFDYVNKVWVPLGAKAPVIPGKPTHLELYATCDDKVVQFTKVVVDGVTTPVTFSHSVSQSTTGQPYVNAAYQLDATGDAKPYKATINNLTVTFG